MRWIHSIMALSFLKEEQTASCSVDGLRCVARLASKATTCSAGARHESYDTPSQSRLKKLA